MDPDTKWPWSASLAVFACFFVGTAVALLLIFKHQYFNTVETVVGSVWSALSVALAGLGIQRRSMSPREFFSLRPVLLIAFFYAFGTVLLGAAGLLNNTRVFHAILIDATWLPPEVAAEVRIVPQNSDTTRPLRVAREAGSWRVRLAPGSYVARLVAADYAQIEHPFDLYMWQMRYRFELPRPLLDDSTRNPPTDSGSKDPTPPAGPSRSSQGVLVVQSSEPVDLWLNNARRGATPFSSALRAEAYWVELRQLLADGYGLHHRARVTVRAGDTIVHQPDLTPFRLPVVVVVPTDEHATYLLTSPLDTVYLSAGGTGALSARVFPGQYRLLKRVDGRTESMDLQVTHSNPSPIRF